MGWNEPGHDRDPWDEGGDVDEFLGHLKQRLGRVFSRGKLPGGQPRSPRIWWLAPLALVVIWLFSGFYAVPAGSRAVVVRLGRPAGVVGPGTHWHWPWPVAATHVVNVTEQRSLSQRQTVLTADGKLASVEMTVDYDVIDPQRYVFGAASPTGVLSALTAAALTSTARTVSLKKLQASNGPASAAGKRLREELATLKLGIEIKAVTVSRVAMPAEVMAVQSRMKRERKQEAAAAASARAAMRSKVVRARRNARRVIQDAQTQGKARVAQARADVARFKALIPAWRRAPHETERMLRNEAMREILASAPKVVVSGPVHSVTLVTGPITAAGAMRVPGGGSAASAQTIAKPQRKAPDGRGHRRAGHGGSQ